MSSEVNYYFSNYSDLNVIEAWYGSICFTLQFYFDFSAYSDMALGSALLFGIKLPKNFNSPLKANSIIGFWQRWHMTLTSFLTNYIYLSIIRKIKNINFFKVMLVTLFTFLVAGIWHGPAWTFLLFGFWHGIILIVNHTSRKLNLKINKYFSWFITFISVNIGFVFFRSSTVDDSFNYIINMFDFKNFANLMFNYINLEFISNLSGTKTLIFILALLIIFLKKLDGSNFQGLSKLVLEKHLEKKEVSL